MPYINPAQQKKLAMTEVQTRVKDTVATVFLASTIIVSVAVIFGAAVALINSLLNAK